METSQLRNKLEQLKGQKQALAKEVKDLKVQLKDKNLDMVRHEKALEVVKTVGIQTQMQLQYHISDITSLALEAVFPDPPKLKVEFVERRNKSECDIYFEQDGNRLDDPINETGGGEVDIAAFALRIASWSMQVPRSSSTIILDEPLKFLSVEYHDKASQMLKEVSEKLGIQFIIVTHNSTLASYADKLFEVKKKKVGKWKMSNVLE